MKFIGRTLEIKKLNKLIQTNEFNFTLIYGRRRVGKSELVKQTLKTSKVRSIYYECKQVAEGSNTNSICDLISDIFQLPKYIRKIICNRRS